MSGCACCGTCCDPVVLDSDVYSAVMAEARSANVIGPNAAFIARNWHPVAGWRDSEGMSRLDLRCDAFNPETRLCTAREDRPPVCRDYPWYGDEPASSRRGPTLYRECSYLFDVPPSLRPEGARPLLPLMVI